jgi:hypothetical protein
MARRGHIRNEDYFRARTRVEDRGHSTPCWIWQLCQDRRGYGDCSFDGVHTRAHRVAYSVFVGPIPEGLEIDHLCRVTTCCNPDHLEAVTSQENLRRAVWARNLRFHASECSCGAKLTEASRAKGRTQCKPCWAAYMRDWYSLKPRPLTGARRARKCEYMRQRRVRIKETMKAAARETRGQGCTGQRPRFERHIAHDSVGDTL